MGQFIDLTGQKFGRLTVVRRAEGDETVGKSKKKVLWVCQCDCGNTTISDTGSLRAGKSTSCGCKRKETLSKIKKTHGMAETKLYSSWANMRARCTYSSVDRYSRYGGRGIKVCEEWNNFEGFMEWALANGYQEGLSIDRIDYNGDYCPENCRWATDVEQANNTSRNHYCTFNGETHTVSEWARMYGISSKLLFDRLKYGWEFERALTQPKQIQAPHKRDIA